MKRIQYIFLISFVCIKIQSNAQLYVGSESMVQISSNATIGITGDLYSNGKIYNTGIITLSGNFDNQNECISTGSLILNGNDQSFYHKNVDISNLTINGGGIKTINSNVSIFTKLDLSNGYVRPLQGTKIIIKKDASITLGSTDSYVDGMLYFEGKGTHYYPIGKSKLFSPVEFQNIEGNDSLILGMELINPADVDMIAHKSTKLLIKSRYYKSDVAVGTFTQGQLALPYFDTDEFLLDLKIGVTQSLNPEGPYYMLKNIPDAQSKINETGISYIVSQKPATLKYFAIGNYVNADMSMLYIPNALSQFAPDDKDRSIRVFGDVFEKEGFSFSISNQWGNLIYKTSSLEEMKEKGWDGTNSRTGRREITGQYHFTMKAKTLDGDEYENAGSIYIID